MTHRDMTRKEFLSVVAAFFGLVVLSRLPFGAGTKQNGSDTPGSYGNNTYGGSKK